jgi:hypothetical protein
VLSRIICSSWEAIIIVFVSRVGSMYILVC